MVGIYVVRSFSKNEYAVYTLANQMQGMLSSLSDLGIGAGVMSIGGKIWQNKSAMGRLLRTALDLRLIFVSVTILVIAPVWAWLIYKSGADAWRTFAIVLAVAVGVALQLDANTYGVSLKLNSQFRLLQKIDLQTGILRSASIMIVSTFWKSTLGVIALTTASWGFGRLLVLKLARPFYEHSKEGDPGYRHDLLAQTKSLLPNAIFFGFYSQASVLMISFYGKNTNIAEIGALGRLSALLLIISNLTTNVIIPSFSRCQDMNLLKRRYYQIVLGFCGFAFATSGFAFLFPNALLFILGKSYANLEEEVGWMVVSSMLGGLCGLIFGLCTSKGWTKSIWISIPVILTAQILTFFLFDLATVKGVIFFGLIPTILATAIYHLHVMKGITNTNTV